MTRFSQILSITGVLLTAAGCGIDMKAPTAAPEPVIPELPAGEPVAENDDDVVEDPPLVVAAEPLTCIPGDTTRESGDTEDALPSELLVLCDVPGPADQYLLTASATGTILATLRFTDLNLYVVPEEGIKDAADCPTAIPEDEQIALDVNADDKLYIVVAEAPGSTDIDYRIDLRCD